MIELKFNCRNYDDACKLRDEFCTCLVGNQSFIDNNIIVTAPMNDEDVPMVWEVPDESKNEYHYVYLIIAYDNIDNEVSYNIDDIDVSDGDNDDEIYGSFNKVTDKLYALYFFCGLNFRKLGIYANTNLKVIQDFCSANNVACILATLSDIEKHLKKLFSNTKYADITNIEFNRLYEIEE